MTLSLAAWLHDWSPFLWQITPTFGVRWYGLSYLLGFVIAWMILHWLARRGRTPLPPYRVPDFLMIMVLGVILGGRIGYVLIYEPSLLLHFHKGFPFWGLLDIQRGGMAYHGAVVGVLLAGWRASRGFLEPAGNSLVRVGQMPWRHVMDLCAFACTIGLGLGRLANFINGELLGRIVAMPGQPAPWWSVRFPQELLTRHAPALDAAQQVELHNMIVSAAAPGDKPEDALSRLIDTLQHGPPAASARIAQQLEPLLAARHPSQLYQAFFEGVVLTLVVWIVWRRPRTPGVVGSWFLVAYGVLRIIAEFFRLPDDRYDAANATIAGLSRGQWLSALMVLAGVGVLWWLRVRVREPAMGGWATSASAS